MNRRLTLSTVKKINAHLHCGGIIAYPTEFCFGLGVLPDKPRAVRRLLRLKKRPADKGLIVIGADTSYFRPYIKPLSSAQKLYLNNIWPAAKTFLVPAKNTVSPWLRGPGHKNLAIRVPAHDGARSLCRQLHSALTATSANRSRKRVCKTAREVKKQFNHKVMIIPGRCGNNKTGSQIIDLLSGIRKR